MTGAGLGEPESFQGSAAGLASYVFFSGTLSPPPSKGHTDPFQWHGRELGC